MRISSFIFAVLGGVFFFSGLLHASRTSRGNLTGAEEYGAHITVLPNGYVVVVDPKHDVGGTIVDAGAVHLYDDYGIYISRMVGSKANDQLGSGGIVVLPNGNFLVLSPLWDDGSVADVGGVTYCNATTGIGAALDLPVTAANSLVGTSAGDSVGSGGVKVLTNGHYVVLSPLWKNVTAAGAGAATWCDGTTGRIGGVSTANSLVGSTAGDGTDSFVTALTNDHYVVARPGWDNGAVANAGAVTRCDGTGGTTTGTVSTSNSLVGSTANDAVGGVVTPLTNGHYVVASRSWKNGSAAGAGAVTWGSGTAGVTGGVTASNSLVGTTASDFVGDLVRPLTNGHYVVASKNWDYGSLADAGAVTWCNGTTGATVGAVSDTNSLVSGTAGDTVGSGGVTALTNGNYVVISPLWNNDTTSNVGAVTWGSGTAGVSGLITTANSLHGSYSSDQTGNGGVTALTNGNYVVSSVNVRAGTSPSTGAATWGDGATGITGAVSTTNSLVGGGMGQVNISSGGVTALTNGNYVVASPSYIAGRGAATWGDGTTGVTGVISTTNSLLGSTSSSSTFTRITPLTNGNYVVFMPHGSAGAATWGDGETGVSGTVSSTISLVGSSGSSSADGSVTALTNGNYVVCHPGWTGGSGAVTWGNGVSGRVGAISGANSLIGFSSNSIGDGGVIALGNGDYAVLSKSYRTSVGAVGAVTVGDGTSGSTGTLYSTSGGYLANIRNTVVGTIAGAGASMVMHAHPTGRWVVAGRPASKVITFVSLLEPDITVEQPAGTPLESNASTIDFGSVPVGQSVTRTFVVKNDGEMTLSDLVPTHDGPQADDFTRSVLSPTVYAPGTGGTFTVTFTPGAPGLRKAVLHIPNNHHTYDYIPQFVYTGESPFNVNLTATALTAEGLTLTQAWRQQHFGDVSNSGDGADTATPKQDGVTNLMKYATGMDPTVVGNMPGVVSASSDGSTLSFVYTRSDVAVAEGLSFIVEWSDTLLGGSWSTVGVTSSAVDQGTTDVVTATVPAGSGGSRFVRLRVMRPQ